MPFSGGCSCGAVRFAIDGYLYAHLCHCDACKKRTGSAYGVSVVVENAQVIAFSGETRTFTRVAESGKKVDYEFCPRCAATLRWHVAALKDRQVLAGGAFDDMRAFEMAGEMYTGMALPWARIGCEVARTGEADEAYRAAVIAKTKARR
ncbi:MAG TPA: GFA family protein [Pseudolabrys sp.]|nr:GFA family protein [Pseudolabrys sp.]